MLAIKNSCMMQQLSENGKTCIYFGPGQGEKQFGIFEALLVSDEWQYSACGELDRTGVN